jgi:hypothetical protein
MHCLDRLWSFGTMYHVHTVTAVLQKVNSTVSFKEPSAKATLTMATLELCHREKDKVQDLVYRLLLSGRPLCLVRRHVTYTLN